MHYIMTAKTKFGDSHHLSNWSMSYIRLTWQHHLGRNIGEQCTSQCSLSDACSRSNCTLCDREI